MVVHIYNNKKNYSQNEDGSPHDKKNNSKGNPPNSVLKKIKEKECWDYKSKEENFFSNAKTSYLDNGMVIITYPNQYQIKVYQQGLEAITVLTKKQIKNYYYNYIPNDYSINTKVYITPIIAPVTIPITIPSFAPAFVF